jgi:hypothetical protein
MTTAPNQLSDVLQHPRMIAVAAICVFIAGFFGLWSALLDMEALDLVNAKRPPEKQFPVLGNFQYFEVRSEYKRLFPSGTLLEKSDKVKVMAIGIFIGGLILQLFLNRLWP